MQTLSSTEYYKKYVTPLQLLKLVAPTYIYLMCFQIWEYKLEKVHLAKQLDLLVPFLGILMTVQLLYFTPHISNMLYVYCVICISCDTNATILKSVKWFCYIAYLGPCLVV